MTFDLANTPPPWAESLLARRPDAESLREAAREVIERARTAPLRSRAQELVRDHGRPAFWALIVEAIAAMPRVPQYGYGRPYRGAEAVEPVRQALTWVDAHSEPWPEAPWLLLELIANVPSDQGPMRNQLDGLLHRIDHPRVLRAGLRHWTMSLRSTVVRRLMQLDAWSVEEAASSLEDRALRTLCTTFLKNHPEGSDAVAPLRDHRLKSVRRLALEIQRTEDPTAGLGKGTLAEAEARLRLDPTDTEASLVWADLQLEQGDPRGQLVAMEHAIRSALSGESPDGSRQAEATNHSAALAAFVAEHWNTLWDRPGGVPFRDRWRGRTCVGFTSDWNHRMRGRGGAPLFEKITRFIAHLTDAAAPFSRTDDAAHWSFRWTHPGTDVLLPYQEAGHHAGGAPLSSTLHVSLGDRRVQMQLYWPFESLDEPGFQAYFLECEKLLGKAFTQNRFRVYAANAKGDQLKGRFASYRSKKPRR